MAEPIFFEAQEPAAALVEEIYEAAFDPLRYSNLVSAAAEVVGGSASLIYVLSPHAGQDSWFGHRFPASAMQAYAEHYQSTNLWAHEINRRQIAVGTALLTDALVDARKLERSEFFADYLSGLEIYRACTVLLNRDERGVRGESHLCIYRSRSQAPFDKHAASLLMQLG